MLTVIALDSVKEDKLEEIRPFYQDLFNYSSRCPGCVSFNLYVEQTDPCSVAFVECWENEDAFQRHLDDPVYIEKNQKILDRLTTDERIFKYKNLL